MATANNWKMDTNNDNRELDGVQVPGVQQQRVSQHTLPAFQTYNPKHDSFVLFVLTVHQPTQQILFDNTTQSHDDGTQRINPNFVAQCID